MSQQCWTGLLSPGSCIFSSLRETTDKKHLTVCLRVCTLIQHIHDITCFMSASQGFRAGLGYFDPPLTHILPAKKEPKKAFLTKENKMSQREYND